MRGSSEEGNGAKTAGLASKCRVAVMESSYAYLVLSLALFGAWVLLAAVRRDIHREMVRVSVGTMFLGLTEPLFVPEYWNPPTLGDLARRTGFDLESLLFSFAIGGIVFSAYHVLFGNAPSESMEHERGHPRHRYHALGGFFATLYCRPDLWLKMVASGVLFLFLYLVVFALFSLAFPGYVPTVWNLKAVSGLLLWGVPLEELLFAFTFGLYWSSMYEHLAWRRTHWLSGIAHHDRGEARPVKGGERTP